MDTVFKVSFQKTLGGGKLLKPCGITTDESCNIYVADSGFHQVEKFNEQGKWLTRFGQGEGGLFKKVIPIPA